jgi:acylglycerol lipase
VDRALAAAPAITLPVLMVHGQADEICSVGGARDFFKRLGSADKAFTEYPGLLHEIFNEIGRVAVVADVVKWLQAHA